jgi:hypothetical protein
LIGEDKENAIADWFCKQCNKMNFARRTACHFCNAEKADGPSHPHTHSAATAAGTAEQNQIQNRDGSRDDETEENPDEDDDNDPSTNSNHTNSTTNSTSPSGGAPAQAGNPVAANSGPAAKTYQDGDWYCKCGEHNFARRRNCFSCRVAKNEGEYLNNINSGRRNVQQYRQGDWNCSKCQQYNFSFRTACYSCNEPKDS